MEDRPKVGVSALIIKGDKVLFGKRKNAHGAGSWCYPGGHLEYGETWEECARREVSEEVGIEIGNIRFGAITNDIFESEQKHYITICMVADYVSGDVGVLEPDKLEEWGWYTWDNLPTPLFLPTINLLKVGFNPFKLS